MTQSLAILCPGQGTQHSAMFEMACTDPHAAALFRQWSLDTLLGMPLASVLADPAAMFSNQMAQPLIVAASLAMWAALKETMPAPALVAGYSIGELAAYGVAGSLTATDVIGLAALRARLMNACLQQAPGQVLAAVSGLHVQGIRQTFSRHGFHIAIQTGEDSVIAGGLQASLPALQITLMQMGARVQVLPVEVASHTPYMLPAVAPFERELRRRAFSAPQIPVLSGISASRIDQAGQALATLPRQIAEPIRWMECMDACAEAGITVALELGPGSSLSRMLQARHPAIECRSIADFRTLAGIRKWLASRD